MSGKNQPYIKVLIAILAAILLIVFSGITESADRYFGDFYSVIAGERSPDPKIVIIHISKSDLDRIGPWPIKRSYYALLIKNLTKQKVNKIGLEVFLSSRLVIQSIYDKVLKNEIERSGRVVLSSLVGRIVEYDGKFYSDSLSYPSPKLLNEIFLTGHLNYIPDNGIIVPLLIDNRGEPEKAFSYQLFGKEIKEHPILLNFRSSWKKFKTYSLIEYFELVQKRSPTLNNLKNKTVLIGISDPQIASTIQTAFDDELPGVALHAFALDNLMNSRWINRDFYLISRILFVIILLGLILVQPKIKAKPVLFYLFSFGLFLLFTFILTFKFNYQLALSFFIFPFLFVLITDALSFVLEKRKLLHGVLDESEVLKRLLEGKQDELLKLQKELDITEELGSYGLIEKIRTLKTEISRFKEDEKDKIKADIYLSGKVKEFHGIVYGSKAMDKVVDVIKKAAPENATILIIGESGTGKELVANAIHSLSARKDNNIIAVNCAALTESLLESELFGHVKGAFTGANNDKIGKFEAADKGTIFLDEIGETTDNFQVKLLRVLQFGEIEKVGSTKQSHVDLRVVAATNKDLDLAVKQKKFREDLYYRLNVIQINLPPLRERKEDIKILALHFLSEEDPDLSLSKAAANAIVEYDWKGNVRELESVIKRGVIFSKSEGRKMLQLSDFPKEIVKNIKYDFEDLVLESLRNKKFSHSSISDTAKELGNVNRTMIAENFRGIVFRTLCENNFDIELSVDVIAGISDHEVREKVKGKIHTFINNIEGDIVKTEADDFEEVKSEFSSKYKNLQK
ncbi:MAG: sigma 54-interacting transcriptional regulator [Ignavibacteria bacterium]|nr:sigma 54-interacting transcriptional regulator [Ignavibacteria bacterium]